MNIEIDDIAKQIMFGGVNNKELLDKYIEGQWEFRKGKTLLDVRKAIEKAKKNGNLKTEYELDWFSLYLKDVFKKKRTPPKE